MLATRIAHVGQNYELCLSTYGCLPRMLIIAIPIFLGLYSRYTSGPSVADPGSVSRATFQYMQFFATYFFFFKGPKKLSRKKNCLKSPHFTAKFIALSRDPSPIPSLAVLHTFQYAALQSWELRANRVMVITYICARYHAHSHSAWA